MVKPNEQHDDELKKKIENYADEIRQITDFVQQVRQTPDVYIGKVAGNTAFFTMVREIFQNSIDEILKGNAFTPVVHVKYNELTHIVSVEDNGRGIPFGKIGIIFGSSHTSSNYDKKPYCYSAGKNGCGASVTNALSNKFIVDSYQLGKGKHVEFDEGHIWSKGEQDIKNIKGNPQGTVISFKPNEDVIGTVTATWKEVYDLIAKIVPSSVIGTTVHFEGIDQTGMSHKETIENKDGTLTYLINMTQNPFIMPIHIANDNGTMKMDMIFTYDVSAESEEEVISLNNTCPTDGGSHVNGAIDGICKFFRNYMNKIYLSNQKSKVKLICTNNDVRTGLKLAISTFHLYALYNGQAKEILGNEDMFPFVSETAQAGLAEWSKSNPNDLQKLCKFFKDVIELRMKSDKDRVKLSTKFSSSVLTGLPDKYIKPNGRKNTELIIVEGDSAFGAARNVRDQNTQGIFPIRGKMPNVFAKSREEILNNAEVAAILTIIGAGYGKNFDLSKCKVSKVIIAADADPDGAHIRTLVLRFLALYCKPLVEAGMVYAALPPLYGIPDKNDNYRFFTDKLEFIKYVQKKFTSVNIIKDINDKILTPKESLAILYKNSDYVEEIERVANNHAIDPLLLETILVNRNCSYKKFESIIKKNYRFMETSQHGDVIILKGLANNKYHETFINPMLFEESRDVIQYLDNSSYLYKINDNVCSLYQLMKAFNSFIPSRLTRFKGLGEMNPEMLGVSTLRPDGDRLLIRYTCKDIEEELKIMRHINDNKEMLLKDLTA